MTKWQLILSPDTPGAKNMAADLELFNQYEAGLSSTSTLRIFSWWPKCVSYGYAQKVDRLIDQKVVREEGWEIVRRPTGGGIVYHNEGEVSYSIVTGIDNPALPEGLIPSYLVISRIIVEALRVLGVAADILNSKSEILNKSELPNNKLRNRDVQSQVPFCFAEPLEYEIVSHGRKIVGSAQKRGKRAMLQQGTICLSDLGFEEISGALLHAFKNKLCYNIFAARV